jgi:hypothetical protein
VVRGLSQTLAGSRGVFILDGAHRNAKEKRAVDREIEKMQKCRAKRYGVRRTEAFWQRSHDLRTEMKQGREER